MSASLMQAEPHRRLAEAKVLLPSGSARTRSASSGVSWPLSIRMRAERAGRTRRRCRASRRRVFMSVLPAARPAPADAAAAGRPSAAAEHRPLRAGRPQHADHRHAGDRRSGPPDGGRGGPAAPMPSAAASPTTRPPRSEATMPTRIFGRDGSQRLDRRAQQARVGLVVLALHVDLARGAARRRRRRAAPPRRRAGRRRSGRGRRAATSSCFFCCVDQRLQLGDLLRAAAAW